MPKAHTPFQWQAQDSYEMFIEKHNYLRKKLRMKNINFKYHDSPVSVLESVFARGDRRAGELLLAAYKNGCKFDAWSEHFNLEGWQKAMEDTGVHSDFYAIRKRDYSEVLPWDIVDSSISKEFLIKENEMTEITKDCRISCNSCGINERTTCSMEGING